MMNDEPMTAARVLNASLCAGTPVRSSPPHRFHLLWDEDLDEMQEIFKAVRDRRAEVVVNWYQLYALHFGDARLLSTSEFSSIFEPALLSNTNDLIEKNIDDFAEHVRRLGRTLAQRGMSLQEVIALFQLLEDAAQKVFAREPALSLDARAKLDKLSHIRIILLVDAYFHVLSGATDSRIRQLENGTARLPLDERSRDHRIIGDSSAMRELYKRIEAAANTRATLLIAGERGTGKQLVAHALHEAGTREQRPFVAFNCAAIPNDLIESELFGYGRGAFSGADTEYPGLFRAAEGGTLFLDEITEMDAETQSKLLRALEDHAVRPVGSTREVPVDVRLVASINGDPEEAVREHILRQDLYYGLQASVLQVPPLRERLEDVPLLVDHFIAMFNQRLGRAIPTEGIEQNAIEAMCRYHWPGNVRELAGAVYDVRHRTVYCLPGSPRGRYPGRTLDAAGPASSPIPCRSRDLRPG
jgi:transcriptional regulator with GAF, ATPase, and Fis domain